VWCDLPSTGAGRLPWQVWLLAGASATAAAVSPGAVTAAAAPGRRLPWPASAHWLRRQRVLHSEPHPSDADIIELNVGGTVMVTSRSTLRQVGCCSGHWQPWHHTPRMQPHTAAVSAGRACTLFCHESHLHVSSAHPSQHNIAPTVCTCVHQAPLTADGCHMYHSRVGWHARPSGSAAPAVQGSTRSDPVSAVGVQCIFVGGAGGQVRAACCTCCSTPTTPSSCCMTLVGGCFWTTTPPPLPWC